MITRFQKGDKARFVLHKHWSNNNAGGSETKHKLSVNKIYAIDRILIINKKEMLYLKGIKQELPFAATLFDKIPKDPNRIYNLTEITTPAGQKITRIKFEKTEDLEQYFMTHFDKWKKEKYSTKIIGKIIFIWQR